MKYEYKVITIDLGGAFAPKVDEEEIEEEINTLGKKGWELVSVVVNNVYKGTSCSHTLYFKRQKQDKNK